MLMGTGDSGFALMSMVVVEPMLVLVVVGMPMFVLMLGLMLAIMFVFVLAIFRVGATKRHDQGHVNVSLHVLLQTERVSAKFHQ